MRRAAMVLLVVGCACRRASATASASASAKASASASASASATESAPSPTLAPTLALSPAHPSPFGLPTPVPHYSCPSVLSTGPFHAFLSAADTRVAFIDGDDLLALVNRSPTGALSPAYAPSDLVDLHDAATRTASECESAHACLRREAAAALHRMLDEMLSQGVRGLVQSAYRGFGTQCWVFSGWARQARSGFCEATEQSALPGHSQHQLGTTVDLFTTDWAERGVETGQGVFRNGFGCTPGGKWIDENAWRHGFVLPYPIDPEDRKDGSRCLPRSDRAVPVDPKTGYKHEPWHLRFIGVDAAARFHEAWLASDPGTPREITLEQWLRGQRGLTGDAELPVCDGCACGACATLADEGAGKTPCGAASLRLQADGSVEVPAENPRVVDARAFAAHDGVVVELTVHAPAHTPTQTPVTTAEGPTYQDGESFETLVAYDHARPHAYADLRGAWRVGIEPVPPGTVRWPWRASLARPELAAVWNRANVVLPARAGDSKVHVRIAWPPAAQALRVALLHDGEEHDVRELTRP